MPKNDPAQTALLRCSPIKIGADYFHVKIIPSQSWRDGDENIGLISFKDKEIRLRDTLRGYVLADTTFHECLHAIWNDSVAGHAHQSPDDLQEAVCRTYESGIAALLLDNPKLLKLLNHYWHAATRKRKD